MATELTLFVIIIVAILVLLVISKSTSKYSENKPLNDDELKFMADCMPVLSKIPRFSNNPSKVVNRCLNIMESTPTRRARRGYNEKVSEQCSKCLYQCQNTHRNSSEYCNKLCGPKIYDKGKVIVNNYGLCK